MYTDCGCTNQSALAESTSPITFQPSSVWACSTTVLGEAERSEMFCAG
jgi:hypothetical protein